jgi:hypothetical protein
MSRKNSHRKANHVCGIYVITCRPTGQRYVGKSTNINVRWYHHRTTLQEGRGVNRRLQSLWNQHGPEAFSFRVWRECGRYELEFAEQDAIDRLSPELNVHLDVSHERARQRRDCCSRCGRACAHEYCLRCMSILSLEARNENGWKADPVADAGAMEREWDDEPRRVGWLDTTLRRERSLVGMEEML